MRVHFYGGLLVLLELAGGRESLLEGCWRVAGSAVAHSGSAVAHSHSAALGRYSKHPASRAASRLSCSGPPPAAWAGSRLCLAPRANDEPVSPLAHATGGPARPSPTLAPSCPPRACPTRKPGTIRVARHHPSRPAPSESPGTRDGTIRVSRTQGTARAARATRLARFTRPQSRRGDHAKTTPT